MKTVQQPIDLELHELIQRYFDQCYHSLVQEVQHALFSQSNEIYGELYYYSAAKLFEYLNLTENDHFLDIGSGLGKIVFQVFMTTPVNWVTGIEINTERHRIACNIMKKIENDLPDIFRKKRKICLLNDDFLKRDFDTITVIYVCSTVFSFELLSAIGNKINTIGTVHTIISFRKLPGLSNFNIAKKWFFDASWDLTPCYLYKRRV